MNKLWHGDCLKIMRDMPNDSVDLVFGSPPYEDARTYNIDFNLKGQAWVDWMVEIYEESVRISKGLVAFVVQGRTRKFKWSCTPALLLADLHRAGFNVRNPPIYYRSGIPGSGGPDWLRSDYEWVVCVSQPGRLVWSDNVACGNDPKFRPGGDPTHRKKDGSRTGHGRKKDGTLVVGKPYKPPKKVNPGNVICRPFRVGKTIKTASHASHGGRSGTINEDGTITRKDGSIYEAPKVANPGNVIRCSGGHLGNKLAHENEAPFPLKLAEFFIKSFCPPNSTTLDPFCGSSTTGHACIKNGRNYTGIDCRQSQIKLSRKRLVAVKKETL